MTTSMRVVVLLAGLVASPAFGQDEACLWEVKGGTGRVLLLGGIHVRDLNQELPPIFEEAYQESDRVAFEIDLDELESRAVELLETALLLPPDGLCERVSAATCTRVEEYVAEHPQAEFSIIPHTWFAPWYLTDLLLIRRLESEGLRTSGSVDHHFWGKAGADNKPRLTLETVSEQFALLSGGSEADQVRALEEFLANTETVLADNRTLHDAWLAGDVEGVRRVMEKDRSTEEGEFSRLVLARNTNWVAKVEGWLAQPNTTLVVGGVGHFVGRESVQNLLLQKGYFVRRLPAEAGVPKLGEVRLKDLGPVEVACHLEVGSLYRIERSGNLTDWVAGPSFLATNRLQVMTVPMAAGEETAFYRLRNP